MAGSRNMLRGGAGAKTMTLGTTNMNKLNRSKTSKFHGVSDRIIQAIFTFSQVPSN